MSWRRCWRGRWRWAARSRSRARHLATEYASLANITYAVAGGTELKLDVYRPRVPGPPRPTLVFIHGGGWVSGAKEDAVLWLVPWLEAGWSAVNVEYRLARRAPAPAAVEDVLCALRWVSRYAADHGFDPARIVVSGDSAGGQLALATAMLPPSAGFDRGCTVPYPAGTNSWASLPEWTVTAGGGGELVRDHRRRGHAVRPRRARVCRRVAGLESGPGSAGADALAPLPRARGRAAGHHHPRRRGHRRARTAMASGCTRRSRARGCPIASVHDPRRRSTAASPTRRWTPRTRRSRAFLKEHVVDRGPLDQAVIADGYLRLAVAPARPCTGAAPPGSPPSRPPAGSSRAPRPACGPRPGRCRSACARSAAWPSAPAGSAGSPRRAWKSVQFEQDEISR